MDFFFHRNQEVTITGILTELVSVYTHTIFFLFLVIDFHAQNVAKPGTIVVRLLNLNSLIAL